MNLIKKNCFEIAGSFPIMGSAAPMDATKISATNPQRINMKIS